MPNEAARITNADRVLEFLRRQGKPLSAYEILEALRGEGVTAATTVYRALDKLLKAGHVHRIESLNAWTVCCEPHHSESPVFQICDICGNVREHVDSRLARNIAIMSSDSGFAPNHSVIEIHGCCSDCSPALLGA
ncbi:MAG: Fur family transcriptional regulator [Gammaproteobacteria bacterium]|nr:Fur family transcriptional regulator [Gammaproteobacteria bacterium]